MGGVGEVGVTSKLDADSQREFAIEFGFEFEFEFEFAFAFEFGLRGKNW